MRKIFGVLVSVSIRFDALILFSSRIEELIRPSRIRIVGQDKGWTA